MRRAPLLSTYAMKCPDCEGRLVPLRVETVDALACKRLQCVEDLTPKLFTLGAGRLNRNKPLEGLWRRDQQRNEAMEGE